MENRASKNSGAKKAARPRRSLTERFRNHRGRIGLATMSAVLYFVGFCGFDQYYLSWFCFVPLFWVIDDEALSSTAAFFYGWYFGTVTIFGGYTWLMNMLREFGGLSLPLALLALVLFSLAHGLLWAAWSWLVHFLSVRRRIRIVWTAPAALVVCEWLFPSLFPTYISNSQYEQLTFIQSLDLWGPLGLSFILTMVSAVLYRVLATRRDLPRPFPTAGVAVCSMLVAGNFLYGWLALADSDDSVAVAPKKIRVGVVQTNMGIKERHRDPREALRRLQSQSVEVERLGAELIVWPESGYPRAIPSGRRNVAGPVLGPIQTPMIWGGIRIDGDRDQGQKLYNTAFATDSAGNVLGTYDKTFLLAFGEYFPLGDVFPILYKLSPNTSHFYSGDHQRPLVIDGVKYGMLICYEDVLTDFVRTAMDEEPDVLVNITNDAWFKQSREPYIHLALAVFRAVEQRRFLIRSTVTGVSAIIDPGGRIIDPKPIFQRANIVEDVAVLHGTTVYQRFGHWVAWLCAAIVLYWSRAGIRDFFVALNRGLAARRS